MIEKIKSAERGLQMIAPEGQNQKKIINALLLLLSMAKDQTYNISPELEEELSRIEHEG